MPAACERPGAVAAREFAYARAPFEFQNLKTCPSRTGGAGVYPLRRFRRCPEGDGSMSNRNGDRVTRERERLDFAKIKTAVQIPNLIDVQKKSYQRFLQMDLLPSEREDTGLQSVFTSVFPDSGFPRAFAARFRRLRHRQLGVQVRPSARPAPPARHLPQLRRVGCHQSL